jgi:hypothetical protein
MSIRKISFIKHDMTGDVDSRRMNSTTNIALMRSAIAKKKTRYRTIV